MSLIKPIGIIHSPYKEKFATPRQGGLNHAESTLELFLTERELERLRGLENFSHLWVIFQFHLIDADKANGQILVRPPRLGGSSKKGIYATRTPHRPNQLGLSVVKIKKIEKNIITIIGGDFVDGSPLIDIKPYIAEDAILNAKYGWTENVSELQTFQVSFNPDISLSIQEKEELTELLKLDPRPAHQRENESKTYYKVFIKNYNLTFTIESNQTIWIEEISTVNSP